MSIIRATINNLFLILNGNLKAMPDHVSLFHCWRQDDSRMFLVSCFFNKSVLSQNSKNGLSDIIIHCTSVNEFLAKLENTVMWQMYVALCKVNFA